VSLISLFIKSGFSKLAVEIYQCRSIMNANEYKTVVKAEELAKIMSLPTYFKESELEITIKRKRKRVFSSINKIKIDTTNFRFDRDEANER